MKKIGGDASYAVNVNREMCTSNGIQTSFVQKGKRAKEKREKDFVRQELARVRATAMEGSFGTAEGALLLATGQGQEEGDRDPVYLLRHSHGECSAAGREADGATIGGSRIVEKLNGPKRSPRKRTPGW